MLKLLTVITGDDYRLVKQADPISRKKISITGSLLLVPASLWLINGFLIAHVVLKHSLQIGLSSGLICGLLIFMIERALINAGNSKWIATFRILLALLVAILGSIGWDEVIFESDINNQMVVYKQEQLSNLLDDEKSYMENKILEKQNQVNQARNEWQEAMMAAQKEADGTGGSGIRGVHGITRIKLATADQLKHTYELIHQEQEALQSQYLQQKENITNNFDQNFNNHSLLTRIKVMFDLIFSDFFMLVIWLLITLLLVFLEFIVILFKLTSSKTAYDHQLEAMSRVAMRRIHLLSEHTQYRYDPAMEDASYRKVMEDIKRPVPGLIN